MKYERYSLGAGIILLLAGIGIGAMIGSTGELIYKEIAELQLVVFFVGITGGWVLRGNNKKREYP